MTISKIKVGSTEHDLSAATLTTTIVGSATQPVYFTNGVPAACTYTLSKSVPSNAVFTDTVYTHPTTAGNKHVPSGGSSGQILKWSADGTATWGADNDTTYELVTQAQTSNPHIYLLDINDSRTNVQLVGTNGITISSSADNKITFNGSHTHNYAGSSSAAGAATSANKLNTNAGDSNTPVYFSDGVPVACTALDLNTTGSSASCTGNSATATKATQDASGNVITDTYMKKSNPTGTGSLSMNRLSGSERGDCSTNLGYHCIASGSNAYANGFYTIATGDNSQANGSNNVVDTVSVPTASKGATSYVLSKISDYVVVGNYLYFNGRMAKITAYNSSSRTVTVDVSLTPTALTNVVFNVYRANASGESSCSEGHGTVAFGDYSHSAGIETTAFGFGSHASGLGVYAQGDYQFAIGKYNLIPDVEGSTDDPYAFVIGNGTENDDGTITRSNAMTVDWEGNVRAERFILPNSRAIQGTTTTGKECGMVHISSADNLLLGLYNENGHPGHTYISAYNGTVYLRNKVGSLYWGTATGDSYTGIFAPSTDGDPLLGGSGHRWAKIYSTSNTIGTSDEREKSDIMSIAEYPTMYSADSDGNVFEQLFDRLIPKTYTLDIEKTNELHIGFIAQDIVKSLEELGLSEDDLGVIDHGYWTDEETGEERDRYGLAYTEFIALNTYMIQKQKVRITELESQVADQEERIAKLEALIA